MPRLKAKARKRREPPGLPKKIWAAIDINGAVHEASEHREHPAAHRDLMRNSFKVGLALVRYKLEEVEDA